MTDLDKIDAILDGHLQEFKAGHADKVRQAIADLLTEARIDELCRVFPYKSGGLYVRGNNFAELSKELRIKELKKGVS